MIGRTLSHYRIVERLGAGGMGVVYRAEDESLEQRSVAIKVLRPDLVAETQLKTRFLLEAKAVASLEHPNLCEIYEIGEQDEDTLFIVMAYYGGGSLRHCIPERGLAADDAFSIAFSAARGLSHVHRRGIIHRDIKPANLMFTRDGYLKIVDFGLAKLVDETRITRTGATPGTIAYMSPQQAAGEPLDPRTDVWSLGVVLYEMLTGKLPFRGDVQPAMLYAIRHDDPVPATEANPDLEDDCADIVHRCLQKDVDARYASAEELARDIRGLSRAKNWDPTKRSVEPVPVPPSPEASTLPQGSTIPLDLPRRNPWLLGAVASVLVATAWIIYSTIINPPLFVTDVRAAVLPIEDRTGTDQDAFAKGMTGLVTEMIDAVAHHRTSMWVAPLRHVTYAGLSTPADAEEALGVNRIVEGDLQRFRDHHRVTLRLLDASDLAVLAGATIEFDLTDASALIDELPTRISAMFGFDSTPNTATAALPTVPAAVAPYLTGWGLIDIDTERAVAELTAATGLDPDFARGRARLARALLSSGSVDSALVLLRDLRDDARIGAFENDVLGDAYLASGDADSAVAAYMRALDDDPSHSYAANRVGRILRDQGRFDEAVALLQNVIGAEPDYFANYRDLGAQHYHSGQPAEAVRSLERALQFAPNDAFSINTLGAIRFYAGDWAKARAMFERSFELNPGCESCTNIGAMYYYEEDYEASARYLEFATAYCDTTDQEIWANLARSLYWQPAERERAVELFRKCIRLTEQVLERRPDDVEMLVNLADFRVMIGEEESARELLARVEPRLGSNGDLLYRVGSTYEALGDRNNALRSLSGAIRAGYPVAIIRGDPELRDLVADVRFAAFIAGTADSLVG